MSGLMRQRGAGSLLVVTLLLCLMLLVTAYAGRGLLFEQRDASRQQRAAEAFEAARAGQQWALALLNGGRIDAACQPSGDDAALPFGERYVRVAGPRGELDNAVGAGETVAACMRGADGWDCSCPAAGRPARADAPVRPWFRVALRGEKAPALLRLQVEGGAGTEAVAQQSMLVALLPALAHPPLAALTARGDLRSDRAGLQLLNTDPATSGHTAHAGGAFDMPGAAIAGPPGSSDTAIAHDAALAAMDERAFFAAFFGMAKPSFRARLPAVQALACEGDCSAAAAEAVRSGARMLWIGHDARLDGPLALGTPARPVLLVADGELALNGAVQLHGVLYARGLRWDGAGPDQALVRGAAVLEAGCCGGSASPSFGRDAAVLKTLQQATGSFVPVPGSWKDAF